MTDYGVLDSHTTLSVVLRCSAPRQCSLLPFPEGEVQESGWGEWLGLPVLFSWLNIASVSLPCLPCTLGISRSLPTGSWLDRVKTGPEQFLRCRP